jgi:hypothetical protein
VYKVKEKKFKIERVEFVFSTEDAKVKNEDIFDKYTKYIEPKYIDKQGNLKS